MSRDDHVITAVACLLGLVVGLSVGVVGVLVWQGMQP